MEWHGVTWSKSWAVNSAGRQLLHVTPCHSMALWSTTTAAKWLNTLHLQAYSLTHSTDCSSPQRLNAWDRTERLFANLFSLRNPGTLSKSSVGELTCKPPSPREGQPTAI